MKINWFPGHMTKSLRMMQKEVSNVDVLIYLLDARAPKSCINPKFVSIAKDKQILYVLNKYDLADEKKLKAIKTELSSTAPVLELNSAKSGAGKIVEPMLLKLSKTKIEKYKQKGIKYTPKAMVIGVPNCGKSTLINNLCGESKAITGNRPGVTRGKQLVTLKSGIQLIDTPGTLWPSFDDQTTARNLALVGSIKDDVVNLVELACEFVKFLKQNYPDCLLQRYKLESLADDDLQVLSDISKKRGLLLKGGEPDIDKGAVALLNDFRKGLLGKICLD